MKKGKNLVFALLFAIGSIFLVYGIIMPKAIGSRVPSMQNYLKHEGYIDPQVVEIHSLTKTVDFKDGNRNVSVRFSNNGLFQIVY